MKIRIVDMDQVQRKHHAITQDAINLAIKYSGEEYSKGLNSKQAEVLRLQRALENVQEDRLPGFLADIARKEIRICGMRGDSDYFRVTYRPDTKTGHYTDYLIKARAREYDQAKVDLLIKATQQFQIDGWKAEQDKIWNGVILTRDFNSNSILDYRKEISKAQSWITELVNKLVEAEKMEELMAKPEKEKKD